MTACVRCAGIILESYDEHLREWYLYCVQCGDRPLESRRRHDGRAIDDPPQCRQGGCTRPCVQVLHVRSRALVYLSKCAVCRDRQNRSRQVTRVFRKATAQLTKEG